MKIITILTILAIAVLAPGCPNRQRGARLIYITPPAPAPAVSQPQSGVLVIQPPPPPAPAESASKPQESEAVPPAHKIEPRRRSPRSEITPQSTAAVPPPADAPQLEPALSPQQQNQLEKSIQSLRQGVQQQIARLSRLRLSTADRKVLQDSHLFLTQAGEAMKRGDLQQALNFARKADLLVSAIEKTH